MERLIIDGLDEIVAGLRKAGAELPKLVQQANKEYAALGADAAREAYVREHGAGRTANTIRAGARQREAYIKGGSARVLWFGGQNFGATGDRHPQFPRRPSGRSDFFIYAEAIDRLTEALDFYLEALDKAVASAFPQGSLV